MTVLEKFEFLIKMRGLSEHKFLAKYHVHFGLVKKLRSGYEATEADVKKLCKIYDFDVKDFLDPTSTVSQRVKPGEHTIKRGSPQVIPENVVLEDYPHEDNSRYEEKD